jgi:hypothetical protein
MIKHIDGAYIAAQIRFVRQVHKGAILILEGETDGRVFANFIDSSKCEIEIAFGKANLLDAVDRLEEEGFPGVVAVADADFDRLLPKTYTFESFCLTDKHDLDLTIFASAALDKYILQYSDRRLCEKYFNGDVLAIRDKIMEAALPFAYCRLASERHDLGIYFKNLKHDELVSVDDLSTMTDELISELITRSSGRCTEAELKAYVAWEAAQMHDPYQLANGHDVAAILGVSLRKLIGSRRDVHTWASEIEAGLRLAFDWEKMTATQVFQFLTKWENNNKRYRIFRERPD